MEFYFEDFTESAYLDLLERARQRWVIVPVSEAPNQGRVVCVWRHDVDVSIERAERIAAIESRQGVRSTFYLMLRSPFYNVFDASTRRAIQSIVSAGHEIGLHFSPHDIPGLSVEDARWREHLAREAELLRAEVAVPVTSFSFHNPTVGGWNTVSDVRVGDLLNAYGPFFRALSYCSDANGYWKHGRLKDVLGKECSAGLYVVTHPEWWPPRAMDPNERIDHALGERAERCRSAWFQLLTSSGRITQFR